jgi:hypothetical protein
MRTLFFFFLIPLLIISSCARENPQPIDVSMKERFKYLPYDPQILIYFNLKEIWKTSFRENFFETQLEEKRKNQLDEFVKFTGLNLEKDVDELILANEWSESSTIIVKGNISPDKIKEYFNQKSSSNRNNQLKFKIIDEHTIIAVNNNERYVSIENLGREKSILSNHEYMSIINSTRYKDQFWIATTQSSVVSELIEKGAAIAKKEKVRELTNSIRHINLSAKFNDGIEINSNWQCKDEASAVLLKSVLNGIVSMATLTSPNDQLVNELSRMDIFLNGKNVELEMKISEEKIKEIRNSKLKDRIKLLITK